MRRVPFLMAACLLAACLLTALASCARAPAPPTVAAGDNGTLDVGAIGASLRVVCDNTTRDLDGRDGRWTLPAGTWRIDAIHLTRRDAQGDDWRVFGRGDGAAKDFQIVAGQVTRVKLGPPIIVGANVVRADNDLKVSLNLRGQGGERYLAAAVLNENLRGAPKIRIANELGEELDSGQFRYG